MQQHSLFNDDGQPSGAALRDAGVALVDSHTPDVWKLAADDAILTLVAQCRSGRRETFTAEDVRAIAGDPPHPNAMGARFLSAVKRGIVQPLFWATATRATAHACRLRHYGAPE